MGLFPAPVLLPLPPPLAFGVAHKVHHLGLRGRRNVDLRVVDRKGLDALVLGKEFL
jgi:hypothetical protein